MHKLILNQFGPIQSCEMTVDDFSILTGPQAAGKSTVAKAIVFFRTVKDDICDCKIKRMAFPSETSLLKSVCSAIRNKFLQLFGSSCAMDSRMTMEYYYDDACQTWIKIHLELKEGIDYIAPKFIIIEFSNNIREYLTQKSSWVSKEDTMKELNTMFCDEYETIFIPAGRNLITLLTSQLNYIFTSMDDIQKKNIDFCTQKYIERILKIRPMFDYGNHYQTSDVTPVERATMDLAQKVLKGKYVYKDGEERLILPNKRFVKINFTSSGQQETVWLINILLYQLAAQTKTFIIVEEPEAHLYPEAQKDITEILSLFCYSGNTALLTTHSPYVLGTVNNLRYAFHIAEKDTVKAESVKNILDKRKWLAGCSAFYVNDGKVISCMEDNAVFIQNEVIDGASSCINSDYNRLFDIEEGENADDISE